MALTDVSRCLQRSLRSPASHRSPLAPLSIVYAFFTLPLTPPPPIDSPCESVVRSVPSVRHFCFAEALSGHRVLMGCSGGQRGPPLTRGRGWGAEGASYYRRQRSDTRHDDVMKYHSGEQCTRTPERLWRGWWSPNDGRGRREGGVS